MATVKKIEGKNGVSYKITASCGYSASGKQVRRYMTWVPDPGMTERQVAKELERQKVLFDEKCKAGLATEGNIKFEEFSGRWFREYASMKLKARTISQYHQYEPHVYAAIGHLRLDRIYISTIQQFVSNLGEEGMNRRTGGKLSAKTIKNYVTFISSVFNYAISQGLIKDNPCQHVTLPASNPREIDCYTIDEAADFLELLENEPIKWRMFFNLAVYGGFRRGEILGFEWKDIDFENRVVAVRRTSLYTKEKGIFTDTPKTKGSVRTLKLPENVFVLLRQYKAWQAEKRLALGDKWIDTDRLFTMWDGSPMSPNSAEAWLTKFIACYGLRKVTVHSFRHLNASLLITGGSDVRTVAASLGHSQASTTLNIYAQSFAEVQARASEAVANTLSTAIKKRAVSAK